MRQEPSAGPKFPEQPHLNSVPGPVERTGSLFAFINGWL
jgi:hypothetical protein